MAITAKLKHLHIAPRKTRLVAGLIKGKTVNQALALLDFTPKKAAKPLYKLLKSAIANAVSDDKNDIDKDNLFISKITVDQGPTSKRWRARSRGQTFGIQKKTSHINIVLDENPARIVTQSVAGGKETGKKNESKGKAVKIKPDAIAKKEKKEVKKPSFANKTEGRGKKFQPKVGKLSEKIFRRKSF